MANNAALNIIFGADTKQLDKALGEVGKKLRKTADGLTDVGKNLSLGLTAPILAFGAVATKNFVDSAKALAQVEAAVASTGGAAGRSVSQLEEMAAGLQRMSLFDDDQILKEVTANLLTFTNVTGTEFDKAQVAILNMSTRLGTDLTSASVQVGKALNDPIKGVKALGRAGVQFTAEQKAQIEVLQESGDIAGAQAIILKELEMQFGGAAEAAAKVDPYTQLANEIGNLTEDFGKIISEALIPVVQFVQRASDSISGWSDSTKRFVVIAGGLLAVLGPTLIVVGQLVGAYTTIRGAITAAAAAKALETAATNGATAAQTRLNLAVLANPYVAAAVAIGALIAAMVLYKDSADKARESHEDFTESLEGKTGRAAVEAVNEQLSQVNKQLAEQRTQQAELNRLEAEGKTSQGWLNTKRKENDELIRIYEDQLIALGRQRREAVAQQMQADKDRKTLEQKTTATISSTAATEDNTKAQTAAYDAFVKRNRAIQDQIDLQEDLAESERRIRLMEMAEIVSTPAAAAAAAPISFEPIEIDLPDEQLYEEPIAGAERFVKAHNRAKQAAVDFSAGLSQSIETAAESFTIGVASMLGSAMAGGEGFAGFGQLVIGTLADLAIKVGGIAVGVAISVEGIKKALQTLNPVVALAAGIALIALGTAAKVALSNAAGGNDVPAFATGGLTTGPMLAMIGDNPSGKEAVIPFERMGEFLDMAGANQPSNVTVTGRISGRDIMLSNERSSRDRKRIR
jgi:hypothetical protein